jgi:hypothetical protein
MQKYQICINRVTGRLFFNGDASCVRNPAQEAGDPMVYIAAWVIGAGRERPERRDAHLDVFAVGVLEHERAAAVTLRKLSPIIAHGIFLDLLLSINLDISFAITI